MKGTGAFPIELDDAELFTKLGEIMSAITDTRDRVLPLIAALAARIKAMEDQIAAGLQPSAADLQAVKDIEDALRKV